MLVLLWGLFPHGVDFLEELGEDNGRVEVEEDGQREGHSLDDDPGHETEELGLYQARTNLRQ